jgi:glycosyltransferase involved in cell wall biosynthesis
MGHKVTLVAGELDQAGILIPELHFKWHKVANIHDEVVYGDENYKKIEREIYTIAGIIEGKLREIFRYGEKKVDLLIIPNVLSLPMHFPLAVALTRTIREFEITSIARNHDLWWERKRYLKSHMFHFFKKYFPPKLPALHHVVINSIAQKELFKKRGLKSEVIADSFNFDSNINKSDSYSKNWRADFGINKDDIVFLQATRIVPRKRIELSIDLMQQLNTPKAILVISGHEGDEAKGYKAKLIKKANTSGIRFRFIGNRVNSQRKIFSKKRIYTLWDCYTNSDFVTYPTQVEGFGNQFVEAIFFKKPIILTPYEVYKKDIAPLGFKSINMPNRVTKKVIHDIKDLIKNKEKRDKIVEYNYKLGKKHLSYDATEKKLLKLLKKMKSKRQSAT